MLSVTCHHETQIIKISFTISISGSYHSQSHLLMPFFTPHGRTLRKLCHVHQLCPISNIQQEPQTTKAVTRVMIVNFLKLSICWLILQYKLTVFYLRSKVEDQLLSYYLASNFLNWAPYNTKTIWWGSLKSEHFQDRSPPNWRRRGFSANVHCNKLASAVEQALTRKILLYIFYIFYF